MQQEQQFELERVNAKLCQVMRVPADFVDVEADSDMSSERSAAVLEESDFSEEPDC